MDVNARDYLRYDCSSFCLLGSSALYCCDVLWFLDCGMSECQQPEYQEGSRTSWNEKNGQRILTWKGAEVCASGYLNCRSLTAILRKTLIDATP